MTKEDIFVKLKDIMVEQFGIAFDSITMTMNLSDDLGADYADLAELAMNLELEFDIREIDEKTMAKLKTVGDVVKYIQTHA